MAAGELLQGEIGLGVGSGRIDAEHLDDELQCFGQAVAAVDLLDVFELALVAGALVGGKQSRGDWFVGDQRAELTGVVDGGSLFILRRSRRLGSPRSGRRLSTARWRRPWGQRMLRELRRSSYCWRSLPGTSRRQRFPDCAGDGGVSLRMASVWPAARAPWGFGEAHPFELFGGHGL